MSKASWHSRFANAAAKSDRRPRGIAPFVVAFALTATSSIGERTKNMARTCQDLIEQGGAQNARTFIQDVEKQLATLGKPRNKLTTYLLELQDPEAMRPTRPRWSNACSC